MTQWRAWFVIIFILAMWLSGVYLATQFCENIMISYMQAGQDT